MKKYLSVLLSLAVVLTMTTLFGCSACKHEFKADGAITYRLENEEVYTNEVCLACGKNRKIENAKVYSANKVNTALAEASDGDFIFLKRANYGFFTLAITAKNCHIVFENGSSASFFSLPTKLEGVVIEGVSIVGSFIIGDEMDGLTIRNFKFSGNSVLGYSLASGSNDEKWIKDLVIDNCRFINISAGQGGKLTAIKVGNIENLTLTNCLFDSIQYNCIQVPGGEAPSADFPNGKPSLKGSVVITGNTFKYCEVRILNLNRVHATSCDISGNTFYLHDFDWNGAYIDTDTGAYGVVIGVNTWEVIPEPSEKAFLGWDLGAYTYDMSEQLLLDAE